MVAEIVPQDFVLPVRLIGEQVRKHSRAIDEVYDQAGLLPTSLNTTITDYSE